MSRCFVCDSTENGQLSAIPWKRSRTFLPDEHKPHLIICSDCSVYGQNQTPTEDILMGEVPNLEPLWDDD